LNLPSTEADLAQGIPRRMHSGQALVVNLRGLCAIRKVPFVEGCTRFASNQHFCCLQAPEMRQGARCAFSCRPPPQNESCPSSHRTLLASSKCNRLAHVGVTKRRCCPRLEGQTREWEGRVSGDFNTSQGTQVNFKSVQVLRRNTQRILPREENGYVFQSVPPSQSQNSIARAVAI